MQDPRTPMDRTNVQCCHKNMQAMMANSGNPPHTSTSDPKCEKDFYATDRPNLRDDSDSCAANGEASQCRAPGHLH